MMCLNCLAACRLKTKNSPPPCKGEILRDVFFVCDVLSLKDAPFPLYGKKSQMDLDVFNLVVDAVGISKF